MMAVILAAVLVVASGHTMSHISKVSVSNLRVSLDGSAVIASSSYTLQFVALLNFQLHRMMHSQTVGSVRERVLLVHRQYERLRVDWLVP